MADNNKGLLINFLELNPLTSGLVNTLNLIDKDIVEQTKRTITGAATDVGQESLQLANLIADKTGIYEFDNELHEKQQEFFKKTGETLFGKDSVEITERGGKNIVKMKEPTYAGGEFARDITSIIGSVVFGTKGVGAVGNLATKTNKGKAFAETVSQSSKLRKTSKVAKTITGVTLGEQVGINPYDARIANFIGELSQDDEGVLDDVIDFMKADENKTEAEARLGLLAESLVFNVGLPAAYFGGRGIKNAFSNKEQVTKTLKELKINYQKGSLDLEGFKQIGKEASQIFGSKAPQLKSTADEDINKLWQFSDNKVKRGIANLGFDKLRAQEIFRPRGYFTPKTFQLFNQQQGAKDAWVGAGEDFVKRLDVKIKNIAKEASDSPANKKETLEFNVQQALTTGNDKFLKELPETLATDVLEARKLLDDFSEIFLQMPNRTISKDLKQKIQDNIGQWMHTSYEIFESPRLAKSKKEAFEKYRQDKKFAFFRPFKNKELEIYVDEFDNAINYIKDGLKTQAKYSKTSEERLTNLAKGKVSEILDSPKDATNYFGRLDKFYGANRDIFKRKANLDKPIRDLLGEIKNPSANLFNSISRVSSFVEDSRFVEQAYQMGRGTINRQGEKVNGYFFKDPLLDKKTGINYGTKIEGKEYGILNGKYTTPEMAAMFTQKGNLLGELDKQKWYKTFLLAKGYGQAAATVLNHVTHARNTIGGAWFMLANGRNPFTSDFNKGIKVLYNKRFKEVGDKESLDYYNKLLSLGVVNSGAKFGDVQSLLKDVSDTGTSKFIQTKADKYAKPLKKFVEKSQDAYISEDDIFKILSYEKELDTLTKASRKANIKMSDSYLRQLEQEAALITKNTLPTYSFVPRGIQQLRALPIGNFFSFPAEMARTTTNIVGQGLKEISSGNSVLVQRGAKRLAGFGIAGMGGAEGLSELTKNIHGITNDEEEALRHLNKNSFSKNSKFLYHRNEKGDLYINDVSFIDPYDVMKRPLQTAIYKYLDGQKTNERLTKILSEATFEAGQEFMAPFTDGALLTGKITDLIFNQGKTAEGYDIKGWIKNPTNFEDFGNNLSIGIKQVGQTFIPGGARQIPPVVKAFTGTESDALNVITGGYVGDKEYEPATTLLANLGIRYEKIDISKNLESKLKKYKYDVNNINTIFDGKAFSGKPNGTKTGQDFLAAYADANKRHYYAYKELKMAFDAIDILKISPFEKKKILNETGISADLQASLKNNKYVPFLKTRLKSKLDTFEKENQQSDISKTALEYYITQQNSFYGKLPMLDLKFKDDSLLENEIEFLRNPPRSAEKIEEKTKERLFKSTGGLVEGKDNVPFTKEDPADRVDPNTGLPYSDQMARLGLDEGGQPKNIYNNMGNIEARFDYWAGLTPETYGKDNRFATFDSPISGMRAPLRDMLTKMERYSNEENPIAHAVTEYLGGGRTGTLQEKIKIASKENKNVQGYIDEVSERYSKYGEEGIIDAIARRESKNMKAANYYINNKKAKELAIKLSKYDFPKGTSTEEMLEILSSKNKK